MGKSDFCKIFINILVSEIILGGGGHNCQDVMILLRRELYKDIDKKNKTNKNKNNKPKIHLYLTYFYQMINFMAKNRI